MTGMTRMTGMNWMVLKDDWDDCDDWYCWGERITEMSGMTEMQ